jgi:amphiphysin
MKAMSAAQTKIADTIDVFYAAADRTSEGAVSANAYKRGVEELENSIGRELVCFHVCIPCVLS